MELSGYDIDGHEYKTDFYGIDEETVYIHTETY